MNDKQIRAERRIGWVYGWLFVSILVSSIWAACLTSALDVFGGSVSTLGGSIATLSPAVVFVVLLFGLRSPYLYARRHTQQALLLALSVIIIEWVFIGLRLGEVAFGRLLILVIWIGGSFWGWRQVRRGECWLMSFKEEDDRLPRPWALPEKAEVLAPERIAVPLAAETGSSMKELDAAALLSRFRNGSPRERQQAVVELQKLGEVEEF